MVQKRPRRDVDRAISVQTIVETSLQLVVGRVYSTQIMIRDLSLLLGDTKVNPIAKINQRSASESPRILKNSPMTDWRRKRRVRILHHNKPFLDLLNPPLPIIPPQLRKYMLTITAHEPRSQLMMSVIFILKVRACDVDGRFGVVLESGGLGEAGIIAGFGVGEEIGRKSFDVRRGSDEGSHIVWWKSSGLLSYCLRSFSSSCLRSFASRCLRSSSKRLVVAVPLPPSQFMGDST